MKRALLGAAWALLLTALTPHDGRAEPAEEPPVTEGVALLAAPLGAGEEAFVDALVKRLRERDLTVRDPVPRSTSPAPDGRLRVRFDRGERSTAVWLDWRGPRDGRGWTVRHDSLDDPPAAAEALVDALDVNAVARGAARDGTGRVLQVDRTNLNALRVALGYNAAGAFWGLHQIEGELRWPTFAVGLGYSYNSWGADQSRSLDNPRYRQALEGSAHGVRADVRWYGAAHSDWYLYAGTRLLLDTARLQAAEGPVEVDGITWINTLGLGTWWGAATGPYIGARAGVPVFSTGSADNYGKTPDQTLLLGFDAELSAGWRF